MGELFENERIDTLQMGGLKMIQAENGYRFSLDPFLLADFAIVRRGDRIADLGTATGVLPLVIAATTEAESIVGIELQRSLFERARRNVELNGLTEKITVKHLDVCAVASSKEFEPESFDVVLMNPPYRVPASGRVSTADERAACRHELHGGVAEFLHAARWLLRRGGRVNVVFLAERLVELLQTMRSAGLEPKRLRMVQSEPARDAHLVLVEGRKGGRPGLQVRPPLCVYQEDAYTEEIRRIFGDEANVPSGAD